MVAAHTEKPRIPDHGTGLEKALSGATGQTIMLHLLERSATSIDQRLILLAPPLGCVPDSFRNVDADSARHRALVREMQHLRGRIYLHDGAIERHNLSPDGLHETPEDDKSWHFLILNKEQRVTACVWYLEHENAANVDDLRARTCPLAKMNGWRDRLSKAVVSELTRARRNRLRYAEVGGWAVAPTSRCTSEGLVLALAAYSLGRFFGGALGMTTATVRHGSSRILRRLGGKPLEADGVTVPPYYDPRYKCEMELLRFDSRRPRAKYAGVIELLRQKLADVPVVVAPTGSVVPDFVPATAFTPPAVLAV